MKIAYILIISCIVACFSIGHLFNISIAYYAALCFTFLLFHINGWSMGYDYALEEKGIRTIEIALKVNVEEKKTSDGPIEKEKAF